MVYSGKSMAPAPMPPAVAAARDALAETLYRGAGVAFDGALADRLPDVGTSVGINHWSTAGPGYIFELLCLAQIELVFHDS